MTEKRHLKKLHVVNERLFFWQERRKKRNKKQTLLPFFNESLQFSSIFFSLSCDNWLFNLSLFAQFSSSSSSKWCHQKLSFCGAAISSQVAKPTRNTSRYLPKIAAKNPIADWVVLTKLTDKWTLINWARLSRCLHTVGGVACKQPVKSSNDNTRNWNNRPVWRHLRRSCFTAKNIRQATQRSHQNVSTNLWLFKLSGHSIYR